MSKGKLFILSGPSGSGKDTVMQKVFERLPELKFSISSITRPMRKGEVEGEKYHFISKEEFKDCLLLMNAVSPIRFCHVNLIKICM